MRYMVIETFVHGAEPVYARVAKRGRMLPDGLHYVDSWVSAELGRCWQLMETDDPALIDEWIARWDDLADFEIVPVQMSAEATRAASRRPSSDSE